jgi:acyl dehydratase
MQPNMADWIEEAQLNIVQSSVGRTITEFDIMTFAGLTGDNGRNHTDLEFAKSGEFGARVAHGLLGLALAQGLMWRSSTTKNMVASLGWAKWDYLGPIFIGDTVHVEWTVTSARASKSRPDRGILIEAVSLINQSGKIVQRGLHTRMVRI